MLLPIMIIGVNVEVRALSITMLWMFLTQRGQITLKVAEWMCADFGKGEEGEDMHEVFHHNFRKAVISGAGIGWKVA